MQMDFSLPCLEEGEAVTLPLFLPGSLLSRQPPVKMHDHHSFSLYHHNVPRPYRLTISYTLKFMTSSQCRNWFSMLWFPFWFEGLLCLLLLMAVRICFAEFFAMFNYIWCCEVRFDGALRTQAAGPIYDNKQWNTETLCLLQSYYRSPFPLWNVTINVCHVWKLCRLHRAHIPFVMSAVYYIYIDLGGAWR